MTIGAEARRRLVFGACLLAIFTAAVEGTIVATAMPTIVTALGGLRLFTWVFAVYFLTQAVSIPIYGRLSDIYGRKRVLFFGMALFLIGSMLCGISNGMLELVAFRTLQGLGAGGVMPVASTLVADLYSPAERPKIQGYLSSTWGIAAVVGPLLGAFLVQHVSWAAIFWINVPIGLVCVVIVGLFFHESGAHRAHRIDYVGSLLLALGMGSAIVALVTWATTPPAVLAALALVAIATLSALVRHERRIAEPMIDLTLFHNRMVAIATCGTLSIGTLIMGVTAFLPTYIQGALGRRALDGGIVLGALSVAWSLGSIAGGRLMLRTSYRSTTIVGALFLLAAGAMFLALDAHHDTPWMLCGSALFGFGFGLTNSTLLVATQSSVGRERRGAATATNLFGRQVGQAVGTALFGGVFNLVVFGRGGTIASGIHDVYLIVVVLAALVLALALGIPAGLSPRSHPA